MSEKGKKFVELASSRVPEQRKVMEGIVEAGVCPFCSEWFRKNHPKPIHYENDTWLLTENRWPYEGSHVHLLFVLKRHAETVQELSVDEWANLGELVHWAHTHFTIPGGMLCMRSGDPSFSGATVCHLHAQFIVPKLDEVTGLPKNIAAWMGTRPKDSPR